MGKNANLHSAKRGKNDEFYTQLSDIEAEVKHYWSRIGQPDERNPFRDKVVFLNCDDPKRSNFWRYFAQQFDHLGIAELIATHYEPDGSPSYAMHLDRDADGSMNDYGRDGYVPLGRVEPLEGNGDFRSPECVELLERADVVITNPPFSLFREYVALLMEHDKKFLILGNINAITYKEIFPLIACDQLWAGCAFNKVMRFSVPESYFSKTEERDEQGNKMVRVPAVAWYTNLDHDKRHQDLELGMYYEGREDEYPKYDNYDAIEVGKTNHIPMDYPGVMGVPITFLDKYNPDQFEILGYPNGEAGPGQWIPYISGKAKYARILVRHKRPQPKIDFRSVA